MSTRSPPTASTTGQEGDDEVVDDRAGAVLLLLVTTARPAQAGTGLSLSLDGRRWSDSIDGELFDSTDTWVPGDEATVTFWVRNDSGLTGRPADRCAGHPGDPAAG